MKTRWWSLWGWAMVVVGSSTAQRIEISWPTPNPAYQQRLGLEAFIQPTESGEVTSGLFGCVRTAGNQFHEALDLLPVGRDQHGEATDEVFAVMPGIVRHLNATAGSSSYGRYVVIEHDGTVPAIYTLYAHLASIAPGLRVGQSVRDAQVLGRMGRSAGGYTIPKERAHLHFEMGVRLTDRFQSWYDWKKFGSKNDHGLWNGMNLVGFDPLAFYDAFRERRVDNFREFLSGQPMAVTVRVATTHVPDFATRYPSLLTTLVAPERLAGWEVKFNATGLPYAWTPLTAAQLGDQRAGTLEITAVDEATVNACRCKDLVKWVRGKPEPDRDLGTMLQLLFGLRR